MIADMRLNIPYQHGELFRRSVLAGELSACDPAGDNRRRRRFGEAVSGL